MKATELLPSISPDALLGKSKLYIQKALRRKDDDDLDEYQLWASLALELLGKAALATKHPSLIVDPHHFQSLLAACAINISTDIKTIAAHTLFDRLKVLHRSFNEKVSSFCFKIAQRRNAELHSGETPFRSMRSDMWEAQYWHAAQLILDTMGLSLENWLGSARAEAPKNIVKHAAEAKKHAVSIRIRHARETFEERKKSERERALADAEDRKSYHYRDLFTVSGDRNWEGRCPACRGKAFLTGNQIEEQVLDTYQDNDGAAWESVEKFYSAEQFRCPVCDLFLTDLDEIEAANIDSDHSETDERELQYEPEYGND
jgi:hypothetical protein